MMNVLVIGAHPDDEILGLGGTLIKHVQNGDNVHVLLLTNGHDSRDTNSDLINWRLDAAKKVGDLLKFNHVQIESLPDQKLDTIPILQITQTIEAYAESLKPNIVFSHSAHDANTDHQVVFNATISAFRPTGRFPVTELITYNTPSSTEWGFGDSETSFSPNYFVDISNQIEMKMEALKIYEKELRNSPHPRSIEKLKASSAHWGNSCNAAYAEAFKIIRAIR